MGSARRHFLLSLIAALITFCSRPIQTSPVASWIQQYSWMLGLFNRRAAAQQSNLVIDWLLVATYPERWNFIQFFCWFLCTFCLFCFSQVVQKQTLGEMGNWTATWWPVVLEYVYQKLLKLDNPSSSYGKKLVFFMPHSVYMLIVLIWLRFKYLQWLVL